MKQRNCGRHSPSRLQPLPASSASVLSRQNAAHLSWKGLLIWMTHLAPSHLLVTACSIPQGSPFLSPPLPSTPTKYPCTFLYLKLENNAYTYAYGGQIRYATILCAAEPFGFIVFKTSFCTSGGCLHLSCFPYKWGLSVSVLLSIHRTFIVTAELLK